MVTDLYLKETDRYQYLHYQSSHPEHIKRPIVYSQALRLKRNCTFEKDFNRHLLNMKECFFARGYLEKMVKEQMKRVVFGKTDKTGEHSTKGVPFVFLFHPKLTFLAKTIKGFSKYLHIDLEVKTVFTPTHMVSSRSARKIRDYLVRAKLYPLERNVGSRKCNKRRCEVCSNIESADLFSSTVTGETFKINHYFNCDSKCLVYLITCRTCKLQYTGHTCNAFRRRWNNYRCWARKAERDEECKQKCLHENFLQDDHYGFLNDVQVTLMGKTQVSDLTKREYFWMRTLKTYYPYGLYIEETYYWLLQCRTFARFCTFFRGISVYYVKCTNASTGFG